MVIIFYRNSLLQGIHNFVLFNLIMALFFALLVFVTGIETATGNEVYNCRMLDHSKSNISFWSQCVKCVNISRLE